MQIQTGPLRTGQQPFCHCPFPLSLSMQRKLQQCHCMLWADLGYDWAVNWNSSYEPSFPNGNLPLWACNHLVWLIYNILPDYDYNSNTLLPPWIYVRCGFKPPPQNSVMIPRTTRIIRTHASIQKGEQNEKRAFCWSHNTIEQMRILYFYN